MRVRVAVPSTPGQLSQAPARCARLGRALGAAALIAVLPLSAAAVDSALFAPYTAVPTGSWPEAVRTGDVNGDGLIDVVLTTSYYFDPAHDFKLFVFLQQADGSLAPPVIYATGSTYANRARSVEIADMNGDGRQDVILGNGNHIEIFLQGANGALMAPVQYPTPMASIIKVGDVNNDGRADVVGLDWSSDNVAVFLQNAGGTLNAPVTYRAPHAGYNALDLGDVNGDGLTDIVVMSGQGFLPNVVVLTQLAGGGFNPPASYSVGSGVLSAGVAIGDVNADGRNDVVVTYGGNQPESKIGVFYQNAAGGLNPAVSFASNDIPQSVAIADVNRDGLADIIVLHGGWVTAGVYLQNADGSLQAEELYPIPYASRYNPHGLAIGDFNGDRVPDIAIADYNHGLVSLLHTAAADLAATVSASPHPVIAGGTLTYSVQIANQGPDAARNARVSAILPGGFAVAATSPGCTAASGSWQCTLLRVDAGSAVALQVSGQPQAIGDMTLSVSAVSNAADPYLGDNTASVTASVVANQLPVANAGADKTVRRKVDDVTLDGGGSYDPDGSVVSYQWRQLSGYSVTLSSASAVRTTFSVPRNIAPLPNALVFELTVTDNAGGLARDTVTVTVTR